MKNQIIFCLTIFVTITGCVMDPPTGELNIFNNSDSAVYVYNTYADSLSLEHGLKLFIAAGGQDACGNPMPDTTTPPYRVNAFSWQSFFGFGTPDNPRFDKNSGGKLTLYFIKEITMKTRNWVEICENRLYEKKMVFNQRQLDSLCWRVMYNGKK